MAVTQPLVVFQSHCQKFALGLAAVERVVPAVEISPLPEAPDIVAGIFNLRGRIIPVINLRRRLGLPVRELALSDQFLVVRTSTRTMALIVDGVEGVIEPAACDLVPGTLVFPGIGLVEGVMRLEDGLIVILDLGKFLSLPGEQALGQALSSREAPAG